MLLSKVHIAPVIVLALTAGVAGAQSSGHLTRSSSTSNGAQVDGTSRVAAVSADGRVVAFQSDAPDLVPGDTNQDTDIFVRDRTTDVVQRVSVAWNGNEARDDSECPALSADGRFVAFRSRAWNMYPGGANLGHPRWDVYVRDRQAATTTRISVARNGGDPNGDSGCPSISGDGSRVVFDSEATNLFVGDDNGVSDVFLYDADTSRLRLLSKRDGTIGDGRSAHPVISSNGRVVAFDSAATNLMHVPTQHDWWFTMLIVRDLDADTFERVDGDGWYAFETGGDPTYGASLSGDGRRVAFAGQQPQGVGYYQSGVFVRDRSAQTTVFVSANDPSLNDCGRDGRSFPCYDGIGWFPKISDDGRFVTFTSRSGRLLPATQYAGDETYIVDLSGGRVRRVSVDDNGWSGDSCSAGPVLSGDGKVLVFASTSTNLVPLDTNQTSDVFTSEWTCNDAGRCRDLAACPAQPAACAAAASSTLRLRKHPPGGVNEDQLVWRWNGPASGRAYPDPTTGAHYQLCLYAKQNRVLTLDVPAAQGDACSGAQRPCWKKVSQGHKLLDPGGALSSVLLLGTPGQQKIWVRGDGALLDAPYLPVDGSRGLTVQLYESDSGRCWGAEIPASAIKLDDAGVAQHGSRHDGRLVATIP